MALGGLNEGVNPLIMASAYVPFVNKGMYLEPIAYTKVTDDKGNVLLDKKQEQESNVAYKESTAFIMTSMLQDVVTNGTAAGAVPGSNGLRYGQIKNKSGKTIPSAGKTGTTNDYKDKWFVGYSPYYVGATWYGYNTPKSLKKTEWNQALLLWNKVMNRIHSNLDVKNFNPMPENIVKKTVCVDSGKVPGPNCANDPRGSRLTSEFFVKGTEPSSTDFCNVHVLAKVDISSKDLYGRPLWAGPYCPPALVQEKVFIKRPVPYLPKDPSDKSLAAQIKDWMYEVPQEEYCTIHNASTVQPVVQSPLQNNGSSKGPQKPTTPVTNVPEEQPDDGMETIP